MSVLLSLDSEVASKKSLNFKASSLRTNQSFILASKKIEIIEGQKPIKIAGSK